MNLFFLNAVKHSRTSAHQPVMPHWLLHMGVMGLFAVAIVDSSVIPLPLPGSTDLLLLWLVSHNGNPWLLASCAITGGIIGGYTTWAAGRKGGDAALSRHVPARLLRRIVDWVQRHPILAVFLPAILPPPIPLLPFALAAGALGIPRDRFLVIFGLARTLRYSFVAWLAVAYGRRIVHMWTGTLQRWSTPLLFAFFAFMAVGISYGVWKMRSPRKSDSATEQVQLENGVRSQ